MTEPKTGYTIATKQTYCYGHGDYSKQLKIVRTGIYGSGPFPPVFASENEAMAWIEAQDTLLISDFVVVPVELRL